MQKADTGDFRPFDASGWSLGIVVAAFNRNITEQLYESALARAAEYKIADQSIETVRVAGAMEIPLAAQYLARKQTHRVLMAIGCVIKGETPHFEYVCKFATEGILRVQLDHSVPIGFGILTCDSVAQAQARAQLGADHLDAAFCLAKILEA